jgi:hypothetical protein
MSRSSTEARREVMSSAGTKRVLRDLSMIGITRLIEGSEHAKSAYNNIKSIIDERWDLLSKAFTLRSPARPTGYASVMFLRHLAEAFATFKPPTGSLSAIDISFAQDKLDGVYRDLGAGFDFAQALSNAMTGAGLSTGVTMGRSDRGSGRSKDEPVRAENVGTVGEERPPITNERTRDSGEAAAGGSGAGLCFWGVKLNGLTIPGCYDNGCDADARRKGGQFAFGACIPLPACHCTQYDFGQVPWWVWLVAAAILIVGGLAALAGEAEWVLAYAAVLT